MGGILLPGNRTQNARPAHEAPDGRSELLVGPGAGVSEGSADDLDRDHGGLGDAHRVARRRRSGG